MRVESIIAINPQQQNNEQVFPITKSSDDKTASGLIFQEYLKANLQTANTPVITRQTESQIAGLLWGTLRQMKITQNENSELEASVI